MPGEEKPGQQALRLFASADTAFSASSAGDIHVYYGHVFLKLPQNMTVSTNIGQVACETGSTVNISREPGLARVQIFDTPNSARVFCRDKQILMDKGQELLLTDHYPTQNDAIPEDGIGRRQFMVHDMGGNTTAVLDDFYAFSCLKNAVYLKMITKSKNDSDKQMLGSLLKFCAALQIASADRGDFFFPASKNGNHEVSQ